MPVRHLRVRLRCLPSPPLPSPSLPFCSLLLLLCCSVGLAVPSRCKSNKGTRRKERGQQTDMGRNRQRGIADGQEGGPHTFLPLCRSKGQGHRLTGFVSDCSVLLFSLFAQ
jgi:hypothetical protein